jgi:hypothetical protein
MRRLSRLSGVLAVASLCSVIAGCGDDDGDDQTAAGRGATGGGGGSGARDASVGGDGGGGSLPRRDGGIAEEEGGEGWPCTATEPCNADLRCAATPFAINGRAVGVCAVACENSDECEGGECITYSGAAADAHCVDVIDEEYELCGVADTSICSTDLTCLYFPDYPLGVCVALCSIGGGDEDAGAGQPSATCSGQQTCIDGILADPAANEGVCGTLVDRGEECGLEIGLYCAQGDVCAPENPNDESSAQRCYQDCSTADAECETGTCRLVQGMYAYCL